MRTAGTSRAISLLCAGQSSMERHTRRPPPFRGRYTELAARSFAISLLCGVALALLIARPATAQSVEQFYRGRAVTMLVGTSPGGINDISARLAARHLSRFIPGAPSIVVQNNPGAG